MKKHFRLLALLMALALVLAACGDGDDSATTTAALDDATTTTEAMDEDTTTTEVMDEETTTTEAMSEVSGDICEVTDVGGVDDRGFNASAFAGAVRAAETFGVEAQVLESQAETDYEVNINSFIDQDCALIVTVGFLLGDATQTAANANPDQPFTIVDFAYDEGVIENNNVKGLVFNTDEAAFLAGYAAAAVTETGTVGTFGGINIPPVTIFMDGFVRGVRYHNELKGTDVEVLGWDPDTQEGSFTNNFESLDDGRAFAQSLVDEGADIVMPVAGPVGLGSAALATELGTFSIIGVDVDGYEADPNNSAVYLTSVLKNIDNAVFAAAESVYNGTFDGSLYVGTLDNDGVGLAPFHDQADRVSDELQSELDQLREDIISGAVDISS